MSSSWSRRTLSWQPLDDDHRAAVAAQLVDDGLAHSSPAADDLVARETFHHA